MLAEGSISTIGPVLLLAGAIVLVISLSRLLRKREHASGGGGTERGSESVRRLREAAERELARVEEHTREACSEIETKTRMLNCILLRA